MSRHLAHRENVILSLHPHNDRGTAIAAAELGYMAGADRIEGCLFGNGERTGNVDLVALGINLLTQGIDPQIDFSDIDQVKRTAEYCNQLPVPRAQPVGGRPGLHGLQRLAPGRHQEGLRGDGRPGRRRRASRSTSSSGPCRTCRSIRRTSAARTRRSSGSTRSPARAASHTCSRPTTRSTCRGRLQIEFSGVVQAKTDAEGGEVTSDQIWAIFTDEYLPSRRRGRSAGVGSSCSRPAPRATCRATSRSRSRCATATTGVEASGHGNGPVAAFLEVMRDRGFEVVALRLRRARAQRRRRRAGRRLRRAAGRRRAAVGRRHRRRHLDGIAQGDRLGRQPRDPHARDVERSSRERLAPALLPRAAVCGDVAPAQQRGDEEADAAEERSERSPRTGSPDRTSTGSTYAPIAESPKNTEPAMFSHVHRQLRAFGSQSPSRRSSRRPRRRSPRGSRSTRTRPDASPDPMRASVSIAVIRAAVVLRLKKSVPTNWTAAAHQSERSARSEPRRGGRRPLSSKLDQRGQREEDRADEEGQVGDDLADGVRVERAPRRPRRTPIRSRSPTPRAEGGRRGRDVMIRASGARRRRERHLQSMRHAGRRSP